MYKEKLLDKFYNEVVIGLMKEKLIQLEEFYQKNIEELSKDFMNSFKDLCKKIKNQQENGIKKKIGYINYSMLRTEIISLQYFYNIEVYDKEWYKDKIECWERYNVYWAFRFLDELRVQLESKINIYGIDRNQIDRIVLSQALEFNKYIIKLARHSLNESFSLDMIEIEDEFEVRVGEYKDLSECVFREDLRIKDSRVIKEWLEEKLDYEYTYQVFRGLDLRDGDYSSIDLRYTSFMECNFSGSSFEMAVLIGSRFEKCNLTDCNFDGAYR